MEAVNTNETMKAPSTAAETVRASVAGWEGVTTHNHRFGGIEFFARTSTIRREPLNALMRDLIALKDMASVIPIESLLVKGLNEITD